MASRIAKPQMGGCGHALFLTLICWESLTEGQKNPGLVSLLLTGASRSELIPQRWIGSLGPAVRSAGSDILCLGRLTILRCLLDEVLARLAGAGF